MYVIENYKRKKAFKEDVKRLKELRTLPERDKDQDAELGRLEARLQVWTPGPFGVSENGTGTIEGPHYPQAHKWYSAVVVRGGVVVDAK
jgi:hypothetical protein